MPLPERGSPRQWLRLLPGVLAFGGFGLATLVFHRFAWETALGGLALALVAGFMQAEADDFFAGLALAFVSWLGLGLIFGTAEVRVAAFMVVPSVFLMTFILGSLCFFSGRLLARCAGAIKKRMARH